MSGSADQRRVSSPAPKLLDSESKSSLLWMPVAHLNPRMQNATIWALPAPVDPFLAPIAHSSNLTPARLTVPAVARTLPISNIAFSQSSWIKFLSTRSLVLLRQFSSIFLIELNSGLYGFCAPCRMPYRQPATHSTKSLIHSLTSRFLQFLI